MNRALEWGDHGKIIKCGLPFGPYTRHWESTGATRQKCTRFPRSHQWAREGLPAEARDWNLMGERQLARERGLWADRAPAETWSRTVHPEPARAATALTFIKIKWNWNSAARPHSPACGAPVATELDSVDTGPLHLLRTSSPQRRPRAQQH